MSDLKTPLEPTNERLSNQPGSKLRYFFPIFRFREFFSNSRDSLVGKSIISTVDQVALSATNFLVGITLLKTIGLGDYGRYSFFFSLLMLIISMHSALIVSPMNVLIAGKGKEEGNQYITSLLVGQFLVFLPFLILGFAVVFISKFFENSTFNWLSISMLLLAGLGAVSREFFKPVFYNRSRAVFVLWIDLVYIGSYLTLFLTTILSGKIHWHLVYGYIFIASAVAGILGVYYLHRASFLSRVKNIWGSIRENFEHGRWILPSVIIANISNYSFMYLLVFLLGDEEAGLASGTRLTVMPLLLCMQSWTKVAVPHGSKLRQSFQLPSLNRMLVNSTAIFISGIALYGLGIFFFRNEISSFLFKEKIGSETALIVLWLVYSGVAVFRRNLTVGLQVLKSFKLLFYLSLVFVTFNLVFGVLFIKTLGITGSVLAMILAEGVLGLATWYFYARVVRKQSRISPDEILSNRLNE